MRNLVAGLLGVFWGGAILCAGAFYVDFGGPGRGGSMYQMGRLLASACGALMFLVGIPYTILGIMQVVNKVREQSSGPGDSGRRKKKDPTRQKVPSRDAVAEKADATKALLARAGKADDWLEPKYLEEVVEDLFQLFQEGWETDDFAALKPWMMAECYKRYADRADHPTRRLKMVRYDEVDLGRVRFVHAAIPKDVEDQSVTVLLTGEGAERLAECWTFARTPARWVLERMVSLASSDAVGRLNDAPLSIIAALKAEGDAATLKHVAHG